jgi:hypothetical protein
MLLSLQLKARRGYGMLAAVDIRVEVLKTVSDERTVLWDNQNN